MKTKKRLLTCIFSLALAVSLLIPTAAAADVTAFAVDGVAVSATASESSTVGEWTVGTNSATVSGKAATSATSGTLTFTAEEDGVLAFDYTVPSSTYLTANFSNSSGTYFVNENSKIAVVMSAGDTLSVSATIKVSSRTTRTLALSNITFDTATVALIGTAQYSSVESALSAATSGDTVRLIADATITENCTIPSGVTLLVPYSEDDTGATNDYDRHGVTTTSAYKTLTVDSDATLTVSDGAKLVVNAKVMGCAAKDEGLPSGTCGEMVLNGDLVIANGGTLYARGYIKGSGSVDAQSGASIYQLFQIKDYRGGSTTLSMLDTVFPVNSYLMKNIQVDTDYSYGARMYGQYFISAGDKYFSELLPFLSVANNSTMLIGTDSDECLFKLSNGASAKLSYVNDILTMTTHGNMQTGAIILNAATGTSVATINSANLVCPFGSNLALIVDSDSTFTFYNDFKVLPGASIQVNQGGTLNVNGGLYIYDHDAYLPGFTYGQTQAQIGASATLSVNGTLSGTVYTSAQNCGNITVAGYTASAGNTDTIKECIGAGSTMTYNDVTFYACNLTSAVVEEETVEEAPEAMIEEAVEEPVEEIVEEPAEEAVVIVAPEVIIAIEEAAIAE